MSKKGGPGSLSIHTFKETAERVINDGTGILSDEKLGIVTPGQGHREREKEKRTKSNQNPEDISRG